MKKRQPPLRMLVDFLMLLLSVTLMGGTLLFTDDRVHQILGMVLLVLWACHVVLNRRWYGAVFKGTYAPYRVMQTVVNLGISICALLLMASGMAMAWFMPAFRGMEVARLVHLASSHWYYCFMCAHIGLHVEKMARKIALRRAGSEPQAKATAPSRFVRPRTVLLYALLALVCAYGVHAFVVRGIPFYLFLRQQFFFLDLNRGYALFVADYVSILVLIATVFHFLSYSLSFLKKA